MFKRLMIALLYMTAITMLVTEANAAQCPAGFIEIGGSCVRLFTLHFGEGKSQVTSESEAELATLVNEAVANDQPIVLQIRGDRPGDQGLSGKRKKVVQQKVQEMLKARNREPDSVRVTFE